MLAEMFDKIREFSGRRVIEHEGRGYSPSPMYEIKPEVYQVDSTSVITVATLDGVIEGVELLQSEEHANSTFSIVVESPTTVTVISDLNERLHRSLFLRSDIFREDHIGEFLDAKMFIIWLQYGFVKSPERLRVLNFLSRVKVESSEEVIDNGVSQKVVTKQGVADFGWEYIPNPITLRPYRTFPEVEQPASDFVMRVESGFRYGLFSADGGMWKVEARKNIANYLKESLPNIKILS